MTPKKTPNSPKPKPRKAEPKVKAVEAWALVGGQPREILRVRLYQSSVADDPLAKHGISELGWSIIPVVVSPAPTTPRAKRKAMKP